MRFVPAFVMMSLCAGLAVAAEPECTEKKALELVRSDVRLQKFCAASVNGQSNGCDYTIRPASEGEVKTKQNLRWIIIASLIHSFDEKNQPRFMPEGASIIRLDNECNIFEALGPSALKLQ